MASLAFFNWDDTATDSQSFTSTSRTFGTGNGILMFIMAMGTTVTAPTITNTLGLTWTQICRARFETNVDTIYCYISDQAVGSGAGTVTVDLGAGNTATGWAMVFYTISSPTRFGASAIRQFATTENGSGASNPSTAFSVSTLPGNVTIDFIGFAPQGGIAQPTGFTLNQEHSINPPSSTWHADSLAGFIGTLPTWTDHTGIGSSYAHIMIETDFSSLGCHPIMG